MRSETESVEGKRDAKTSPARREAQAGSRLVDEVAQDGPDLLGPLQHHLAGQLWV